MVSNKTYMAELLWNSSSCMDKGEYYEDRRILGTVVCLDRITQEGKSLSLARILINTYVLQTIQGWMYLSISDRGFDIYVKEISKDIFNIMCFNNTIIESK